MNVTPPEMTSESKTQDQSLKSFPREVGECIFSRSKIHCFICQQAITAPQPKASSNYCSQGEDSRRYMTQCTEKSMIQSL